MRVSTRLATWMGLGALLLATTSSGATAAIIDDFATPGLGEYTMYKILDQNAGDTNISFSDASGSLSVLSTGTTGAEQVLLLRSDVSLAAGQELRVDGPVTETASGTEDLGLAIGATPSTLGNPQAGDVRNQADFAFISFRNPTQLNSRGFIANAEIGQIQAFGVNADTLFIARLDNDDMELGYYDGATRNVMRTITPTNLAVYDNVGFYADLRADAATIGGLGNLQVVPEPASIALAGLAIVGLLTNRRR